MTTWTDFLKKNAGKGYTRDQLKELYRREVPLTKAKKEAKAKVKPKSTTAKPKAKPAKKAKVAKTKTKSKAATKLPVESSQSAKSRGVAMWIEKQRKAKEARMKETAQSISIGDYVVVHKKFRTAVRTFPVGISWVEPDTLRNSVEETKQFIADLEEAVRIAERLNKTQK